MIKGLLRCCRYATLILAFAFASSGQASQENVGKGKAVKNKYIVVLKDREFDPGTLTNAQGESVRQISERLVIEARQNQVRVDVQNNTPRSPDESKAINKLGYVYETAIKGFSVTLTDEAVQGLKNNPAVEYVERDYVVSINAIQTPTPSWGLDRIDQRDLPLDQSYQYNTDGSNVHIYIIDSGVRASHAEFVNRIGNGYDFIDNDNNADDCNGHGTHVAGTAAGASTGVAKNAIIHPLRVFDCQGSGTWGGVIAAVNWVAANHISPSVANMSLGGSAYQPMDTAVNNTINAGVSVVVAAGNDDASDACNTSPARVANAITVASSTASDQRSSFSNIGTCVDIIAPGSTIWSAFPPYAYLDPGCHDSDGDAYGYCNGTSMASPHVAGVAALYLESNVSASPSQVASAIITDSTQNKISDAGVGTPNRLLFSQTAVAPPPPPPPPPQNLAWLIPVINLILF